MLVVVLDHTIRDLVFYSVGIIINMSLHEEVRPALLKLPVVDKLIDVLRDANLEDMDLAKVSAKAIHNLQGVQNTNQFWSEEAVKKLDEFTQTFGEELDEIMVSRQISPFSHDLIYSSSLLFRMSPQTRSQKRSRG